MLFTDVPVRTSTVFFRKTVTELRVASFPTGDRRAIFWRRSLIEFEWLNKVYLKVSF